MNFIGNRNFRAGPQTSLEGFICPQNSDKQQKIKVFGRSGGVISSGSVVVKNVEAMSVVGGNPAKEFKKRKCVHKNLVVESLLGGDYDTYKKTRILKT